MLLDILEEYVNEVDLYGQTCPLRVFKDFQDFIYVIY